MRDYYRRLPKNELSYDKMLVFFTEAVSYCQQNDNKFLRYAQWRTLCDKKVSELTGAAQEFGGGSFDSLIEKLSDPEIPVKDRYFERIEVSKKETRFYPNILLMNNYIQRKQRTNTIMNYDIQQIGRGVIESMEVTDNLGMEVIHGPLYYIVLFYFLFQGFYLCG